MLPRIATATGDLADPTQDENDAMPGVENVSEEPEIAAADQPDPIEAAEVVDVETVYVDAVPQKPRDPLSIAIVAGLAAFSRPT